MYTKNNNNKSLEWRLYECKEVENIYPSRSLPPPSRQRKQLRSVVCPNDTVCTPNFHSSFQIDRERLEPRARQGAFDSDEIGREKSGAHWMQTRMCRSVVFDRSQFTEGPSAWGNETTTPVKNNRVVFSAREITIPPTRREEEEEEEGARFSKLKLPEALRKLSDSRRTA